MKSILAYSNQKFLSPPTMAIVSYVFAIFVTAFSLYPDYVRDNNPGLTIKIISETNVLDIKADIKELKIIYDNEDIKKQKEVLSVSLVEIKNTGRTTILSNYYDKNYPIRIILKSKGRLLKISKEKADTSYLFKTVVPSLINDTEIRLSEVILEPNESYILKVLILHPSESKLNFSVDGKIAGIDNILFKEFGSENNTSLIDQTIQGSLYIQIMRFLVYSIIPMVITGILYFLLNYFFNKYRVNKRIKIIKRYKSHKSKQINFKQDYDVIFDAFIKNGFFI